MAATCNENDILQSRYCLHMYYLGPDRPLTSLSTWSEVVQAAEGGLLGENQWCELKETLPPPNKKCNIELAKDLASLSIYGGVFIVGVSDDMEVVGTDVGGMTTRISQVSATRIDPPLSPIIHDPIEGPSGHSVEIIEIPPSPVRPHMVDGSYWGRSSDGKRRLNDAEVRTLLIDRSTSEEEFRNRLLKMVDSDPLETFISDSPTGHGHIFIMADPMSPISINAVDTDIRTLASKVPYSQAWDGWGIADCTFNAFDPEGRAYITSRDTLDSRHERHLTYFTVKDSDNSVQVISGAGTVSWPLPMGDEEERVLGSWATTLVQQVFQFIGVFSSASGYSGLWRVGVHFNNLRGKKLGTRDDSLVLPGFVTDTYTQTCVISAGELINSEHQVKKFLKGYHRGLGIESWSLDKILRTV
ncbi:ATP-binding protein [Propionibacterium freudenreichii]|nr:ATP-binding protein [Propionibacterium freudenreichii]SPB30297.1 hypothetical protein MAJHIDBO_00594 [Propionibacterium freudenreichii subsp. shermanii]MCT3006319.1 ATP-binding protein [Propionibacterium freudenreichii]MCT3010425.1 ATP-binding protein [Propionibacterium freudenreichii]SCQ68369.1 Hypothetical protein PFR_JS15-1_2002 [Propionibacterium freudenreichii]